jgi:hypothetical protein
MFDMRRKVHLVEQNDKEEAMVKRGKAPSAHTVAIRVKVTPELKESIEAAAAEIVPAGIDASVADVARVLIVRGLESLKPSRRPTLPDQGALR